MNIIFLVMLLVVLIIVYVPAIFFLLHLYKLLSKCKPKNRTMDPGLVWLNLIPIFLFGWIFYTVIQIKNTLKKEFKERNLESDDPQFGYGVGLAFCITFACSIVPILGFFTSIASLILWVIYWVKTYKYSKLLN